MTFFQQRWDILSQDFMMFTAYLMLVFMSIGVIVAFVLCKGKYKVDRVCFLGIVMGCWALIFMNPMQTQTIEVLESEYYDVELSDNLLYSSDELNIKVKMPDGSERTLDFGKLDIVLEEEIEAHRLEVSPYIVESIYLHRTAYESEEEYTLYIKSDK